MFRNSQSFNRPLQNWERTTGVNGATSTSSNVTDMGFMFYEAKNFNQPLNR